MDEIQIIKEFFSKLRCMQCSIKLTQESISVVRQETNYTVIRILCSNCGKNIGMAILGLDKTGMKNSMKLNDNSEKLPITNIIDEEPISYDDVIDAHEFFENLGNDWLKYIPEDCI